MKSLEQVAYLQILHTLQTREFLYKYLQWGKITPNIKSIKVNKYVFAALFRIVQRDEYINNVKAQNYDWNIVVLIPYLCSMASIFLQIVLRICDKAVPIKIKQVRKSFHCPLNANVGDFTLAESLVNGLSILRTENYFSSKVLPMLYKCAQT